MAWSPIDTADDTAKDGHDLLVALEPGGRQAGGQVAQAQVLFQLRSDQGDPSHAVRPCTCWTDAAPLEHVVACQVLCQDLRRP